MKIRSRQGGFAVQAIECDGITVCVGDDKIAAHERLVAFDLREICETQDGMQLNDVVIGCRTRNEMMDRNVAKPGVEHERVVPLATAQIVMRTRDHPVMAAVVGKNVMAVRAIKDVVTIEKKLHDRHKIAAVESMV
jgi:hypothetical protein